MRKSFKTVLGVTLLEIMLVLAIAAMIIVMSIRYYQSASLNQKIAATVNNVTGIVAAAESYLSMNGSLTGVDTGMLAYLPGARLPNSGWGGAMTISNISLNGYNINIPSVPNTGCAQLRSLLVQNTKFTIAFCPAAGPGFATMVVQVLE
ncbi:MAG: hypothetical protein ACD_60C00025G0041 [uncultured bacterium]|nr:MAG: hypothetical protein ACD_60C00025G0041 [uncultured bacterium]